MAIIIDNSIAFLFLIATSIYITGTAVITVPPRDATVLFNHVAVFNCTGKGDGFEWTYDGHRIHMDERITLGLIYVAIADDEMNMFSLSLYINATIEDDGANIGCNILNFTSNSHVSAGAVLTVVHISPVRDLSLSIDDVPYVTWTIPSVIAPDIPVSDIRYTVTLEGGNITSTVNDIDDTYYQFTDITVLNCTVYTATVTAFDVNNQDVYRSDAATADNYTIDTGKNILCISSWQ